MPEDEKDEKTETIYARVPASLKYAFEDLAKERTRKAHDDKRVTLTDLLTVAMREYLARQQPAE
jgi:hypothetical protein